MNEEEGKSGKVFSDEVRTTTELLSVRVDYGCRLWWVLNGCLGDKANNDD